MDIEKEFKQYQKLIYSTIKKNIKLHGIPNGCDWDDLESVAVGSFLSALETYKDDLSSKSSWIYRNVVWSLLSFRREKKNRRENTTLEFPEAVIERRSRPLTSDLSTDACYVVDCILDAPTGVARVLFDQGRQVKHVRRKLTELLDGQGWHKQRIANAFFEVTQNISTT